MFHAQIIKQVVFGHTEIAEQLFVDPVDSPFNGIPCGPKVVPAQAFPAFYPLVIGNIIHFDPFCIRDHCRLRTLCHFIQSNSLTDLLFLLCANGLNNFILVGAQSRFRERARCSQRGVLLALHLQRTDRARGRKAHAHDRRNIYRTSRFDNGLHIQLFDTEFCLLLLQQDHRLRSCLDGETYSHDACTDGKARQNLGCIAIQHLPARLCK